MTRNTIIQDFQCFISSCKVNKSQIFNNMIACNKSIYNHLVMGNDPLLNVYRFIYCNSYKNVVHSCYILWAKGEYVSLKFVYKNKQHENQSSNLHLINMIYIIY